MIITPQPDSANKAFGFLIVIATIGLLVYGTLHQFGHDPLTYVAHAPAAAALSHRPPPHE